MRNANPTPVTCALCGATHGFNPEKCWVYAGMGMTLYALCETCLGDRHARVEMHTTGKAVFAGESTLADLEARVERLERRA